MMVIKNKYPLLCCLFVTSWQGLFLEPIKINAMRLFKTVLIIFAIGIFLSVHSEPVDIKTGYEQAA